MDFSKYTKNDLKQIIRNYNLHYHIPAWSKKTRAELEQIVSNFMNYINDEFYIKDKGQISKNKVKGFQPKPKPEKKLRKAKKEADEDWFDKNEDEFLNTGDNLKGFPKLNYAKPDANFMKPLKKGPKRTKEALELEGLLKDFEKSVKNKQ